MSNSSLYLPPTGEHEVEFLVAADERSDPCAVKRFKSAFGPSFPDHLPGQNRFGKALERGRPERGELEEVAEHLPRRLGNDHSAVPGEPLQSSCEVGCLARDPTLLRLASADKFADHDEPRSDADASPKTLAGRRQIRDAIDQREFPPGPPARYRPRGPGGTRSR